MHANNSFLGIELRKEIDLSKKTQKKICKNKILIITFWRNIDLVLNSTLFPAKMRHVVFENEEKRL